MQLPIGPEPTSDKRQGEGIDAAPAPTQSSLSLESQMKLRALYEYLETSRASLKEIYSELSLFEATSGCSPYAKRICERLENFCIEADSWGFNALYEIGLGLQVLLLNSNGRVQNSNFWDAINRGLAMLSALLDECESDFRRRLAVADMLECISRAY